MTALVTTPSIGRGAWPGDGAGGTLSTDGTKPGGFFTKNVAPMVMVGKRGYDADRYARSISVNDYAPYAAVKAIQTYLGLTSDGLLGNDTKAGITAFQKAGGLGADGVYGPNTARAMWSPLAAREVTRCDSTSYAALRTMVFGTIAVESGWDIAAVGRSTPDDVGIGQINGRYHPDLSVFDRLNPVEAIPYLVALIDANLKSMNGVMRDGIAAYNLGVGGAQYWISQGRPDKLARLVNGVTVLVDVKGYIDKIIQEGS